MGKLNNRSANNRHNNKSDYYKQIDNLDEIDLNPSTPRNKKIKTDLSITLPFELTIKQQNILEHMMDNKTKMVLLDCLWGTGKTFISVLAALSLLQKKKIEKIYYVRTPKESSNTASIGYLPGDASEKMQSYNIVMEEKLEELLSPTQIKSLIADKTIEFLPPGFMRGRSLKNSVLICDEASNFSWEDILLICSRLGENSKIFMVGDSFQNDIGKKSGFVKFIDIFNDEESRENGVYYFEMKSKEDIVRSGFVRFLMDKINAVKPS